MKNCYDDWFFKNMQILIKMYSKTVNDCEMV